jgi:hypothetical protein
MRRTRSALNRHSDKKKPEPRQISTQKEKKEELHKKKIKKDIITTYTTTLSDYEDDGEQDYIPSTDVTDQKKSKNQSKIPDKKKPPTKSGAMEIEKNPRPVRSRTANEVKKNI